MEPHAYNVEIEWVENRKGIMSSPELNQKVEVATPPNFPKGIENIWSPEHLLTAAVSSCFMTTFLAIAENFKLEFTALTINSRGILEQIDGKYLMTEVILEPTLTITNAADKDKADRVLHKSEAACLISNSIKSKVTLSANILVLSAV